MVAESAYASSRIGGGVLGVCFGIIVHCIHDENLKIRNVLKFIDYDLLDLPGAVVILPYSGSDGFNFKTAVYIVT